MTKNILTSLFLLLSLTTTIFAQLQAIKSVQTKTYNPSTNLVIWPNEFNPEKSKWYVYNEIEINAKPEIVLDILIDAKKWHTYYKGLESPVQFYDSNATTLRNGLVFKMHTMGLHLEPVMKEFVPNERMAWEVRRKNLKAYHAWVIVPTATGCRLITPESQNGFLTFLQRVFQPNKLMKLHDIWLRSIKEQAEKQP